MALPVLVVLATLPIGAVLRPAGADTVSDLRSQAATLAHDLVLAQLQEDAAQQATSVASAQLAADQQAIDQLDRQMAADQQAIDQHLHVVQAAAIRNYIDSGADSAGADTSLFEGSTSTAQAASEYSSLAVGNITTELDQLHTAQHALAGRQVALQARQAQDRADQARRAADLGQASTAAAQLQAEQAQVTGQLATAVASQQAAEARAAEAAVAAAAHNAPRTSSTPASTAATIPAAPTPTTGTVAPPAPAPAPTSSGSSGDPYPSLSDPALNSFLTCVVQAESGGDYGVVSPNGLYMGAFQFSQPTWNTAATAAGLPLLVGVPPNDATRAEQDTVAVTLYSLDGEQPWLGDRCSG